MAWGSLSFCALAQTSAEAAALGVEESSLEEDLWTAFHLRPEVQDANARYNAAYEEVCALESGAPAGFPFGKAEFTVDDGAESSAEEAELKRLLCFPFPVYTPMIAEASFDETHTQLFTALTERTQLFLSIRLQVIQARLSLKALRQQEDAALQELRQAEEDARMSLERARERVGEPYEIERTQIAVAEKSAASERARKKVMEAEKMLDCALGRMSCPSQGARARS